MYTWWRQLLELCLKYLEKLKYLSVYIFSQLARTNSGSSTDSGSTPLKLLQRDTSTGEYIVSMTQAEFDRLASQQRASTPQNGK